MKVVYSTILCFGFRLQGQGPYCIGVLNIAMCLGGTLARVGRLLTMRLSCRVAERQHDATDLSCS